MPLPTALAFTTINPTCISYRSGYNIPLPLKKLKSKLRALKIPFKATATRARCDYLLQRYHAGQLFYEPCTVPELQTFVSHRKISCKAIPAQHTQLVRLLERADDDPLFEKFLDLPAELRLVIYEMHLSSIGRLSGKKRIAGDVVDNHGVAFWKPSAPALCLVSKFVARESLSLFGARVLGEKA